MFRVQGSGFRVQGSGFRVQGSESSETWGWGAAGGEAATADPTTAHDASRGTGGPAYCFFVARRRSAGVLPCTGDRSNAERAGAAGACTGELASVIFWLPFVRRIWGLPGGPPMARSARICGARGRGCQWDIGRRSVWPGCRVFPSGSGVSRVAVPVLCSLENEVDC